MLQKCVYELQNIIYIDKTGLVKHESSYHPYVEMFIETSPIGNSTSHFVIFCLLFVLSSSRKAELFLFSVLLLFNKGIILKQTTLSMIALRKQLCLATYMIGFHIIEHFAITAGATCAHAGIEL